MRHIRLSDYGIGLLIFSAIGLSEYRISDWRIQKTIGLSDVGLSKTYRLPIPLQKTYVQQNYSTDDIEL